MAIVFQCDRCGALPVKKAGKLLVTDGENENPRSWPNVIKELCASCRHELDDWLKPPPQAADPRDCK